MIGKNICFFDVEASEIDRYFTNIIGKEIIPKMIIIDSHKELLIYKENGYHKQTKLQSTEKMSSKKIIDLLTTEKIDVFLINAHRIPDIRFIVLCKKISVKIYYIQHGMYIPFMKRSLGFFVKKAYKTVQYLKYAIEIGKETNSYKLSVYLFLIHVLGFKRDLYKKYKIFPDKAIVFSLYWEEWHYKHYAFPEDINYLHMGIADYKKFKFSEKLSDNVISYCYQTLVEDGRIDKQTMLEFYKELIAWIEKHNFTLVVKAHPRMNSEFIDYFNQNNIEIFSDKVPNTNIVIGHYSSLLSFWGGHGRKVLCYELEKHTIDESISSWSFVFKDFNKLELEKVECDIQKCHSVYGKPDMIFDFKNL